MPSKLKHTGAEGNIADALRGRAVFAITHLLQRNCNGEHFLPGSIKTLAHATSVLVNRRATIPPLDVCSLRFVIERDQTDEVIITITRTPGDIRPIEVPDEFTGAKGQILGVITGCLPASLGVRIY
jgi:hypothetical protein